MSLNEQQVQAHYRGIGGSLAPAVLGVDPYKTPIQAYLELTDPHYRDARNAQLEERDPVIFGTVLEEPIAQEAARRLGIKVRRVHRTLRHPDHPWMLAHPDRLIVGQREGLEIKSRSQWKAKDYGEDDTDEVLFSELVQIQHYMAVTGYGAWRLAVLLGGNRLRLFRVQRDEELIATLIEREAAFWQRVETLNPPEPTTLEDLDTLYPQDSGAEIRADETTLKRLESLKAVKAQMKALEAQKAELELSLKAAFAEAATLLDSQGRAVATYKTQSARRLDTTALKAAHPELIEPFTRVSTYRVLRLKEVKADVHSH